ncbi:MAG TPA: helix-turn-helix domain-containing protein [Gaiellaceae bacterium]|jgi:AcrR family transcriptional regulator|nr:helix-turn-helix domain-containing protein [Gaiellaceae bacterium]
MATRAPERKSAEVRREEILEAAMKEFAHGGLHGTSTEAIAKRAGISQPYLFRLFGTKKELFIASSTRGFGRVLGAFQEAAEGKTGPEAKKAMGQAYDRLLADRELLLGQLQTYAACSDPEIRDATRHGFAELFRFVEQATGLSTEEIRDFFALGMLMNVAAAMDLPQICKDDDTWAQELRTA